MSDRNNSSAGSVDALAKTIWLAGFERAFSRTPTDPWENQAESAKAPHINTARKIIEAGFVTGDAAGCRPPAAPVEDALGYAQRLATILWEKHYKADAPDWKPLPDIVGVLTQIDNMTVGLQRSSADSVSATTSERNAWADELQGMIDREEIPDNEMHKATTVLNLLRVTDVPQEARVTPQAAWQPVDTAPHEERVLLGWYQPDGTWFSETGMASHGWRRNGISNMSRHGAATHWQPLPIPLTAEESK